MSCFKSFKPAGAQNGQQSGRFGADAGNERGRIFSRANGRIQWVSAQNPVSVIIDADLAETQQQLRRSSFRNSLLVEIFNNSDNLGAAPVAEIEAEAIDYLAAVRIVEIGKCLIHDRDSAEIPTLPPYDPAKDGKFPCEDEVVAAIEKLRGEEEAEDRIARKSKPES